MKQMKARLALCFGGRIAEQLIYGKDELNTGASNDIQQATDMARSMVMEYGMSEKLGWLRYRDNQDEIFLGHSVSRAQNRSEEHTYELQSLMRISYAVLCLKKKKNIYDQYTQLILTRLPS